MNDPYETMCAGCWREKFCHEDMEYCDAYLELEDEEAATQKEGDGMLLSWARFIAKKVMDEANKRIWGR